MALAFPSRAATSGPCAAAAGTTAAPCRGTAVSPRLATLTPLMVVALCRWGVLPFVGQGRCCSFVGETYTASLF